MDVAAIEFTDILLRFVGAFYALAGVVATRAAMASRLLDVALAAISARKPSRIEALQSAWLITGAAIVLAGGVLLLAGLEMAAWAFIVSATGQAAYIFLVAPRYFDREDPPDPRGRRQTTNAFVVFLAATALVVWAAWRGRLATFGESTVAELVAVATALLLYGGWVARTLWWERRATSTPAGAIVVDPDTPPRPLHTSKRIKLMADYGCDPLWALDDDLYGCFPPEHLDLSEELTGAIRAWAADYESAVALDDPATGLLTEARHAAHEAEGRRLAVLLKRERPDIEVYVPGPEGEAIEVRAEDAGPA